MTEASRLALADFLREQNEFHSNSICAKDPIIQKHVSSLKEWEDLVRDPHRSLAYTDALEFYADQANWMVANWPDGTDTPQAIPFTYQEGSQICDCGDRARAALTQATGGEPEADELSKYFHSPKPPVTTFTAQSTPVQVKALEAALAFIDTALVADENPTMSKRMVMKMIRAALTQATGGENG